MSTAGNYLYGFTEARFQPPPALRGLGGAPLRLVAFGDVAAVVSRHPVCPMMPLRCNLEPHHRVVRQISSDATLVPAAFGHVSESDDALLAVLRDNHSDIRGELERLSGKCEMGLKLSWKVANIFEYFVRQDQELRELRDRVFRRPDPPMAEKLQVGELFAAKLTRERERLTALVMNMVTPAVCDVVPTMPRNETVVCQLAVMIERARAAEYALALQQTVSRFDATYSFDSTGPWPPYSFVRLRLQSGASHAAA